MGFIIQVAKVAAVALPLVSARPACSNSTAPVKQITCGGKPYTYKRLAGYGGLPGNATDKYGDTLGGYGSSIALQKGSWEQKDDGSYTGIIFAIPDRGWNTNGTLNYQSRIQKLEVTFTPDKKASVEKPGKPNIEFKYLDTILITDPAGNPTTGLDADPVGTNYLTFPGFNFTFPTATYPGDGFGGAGPGGKAVSVDAEGLVIDKDGNFWVSDEYGPYIYKVNKRGRVVSAIQPPAAFLPRRNGSISFASVNPPVYDPKRSIKPSSPNSGRNNNQGFEGLTISPDSKTLYVLLQSATIQDGGSSNPTRRNTRFLVYDISSATPSLTAEYVVQLPFTPDGKRVTAQSEVHYVSATQFLILSRDSNNGAGLGNMTQSAYRHADVFDISKATNVRGGRNGTVDGVAGQVATVNGTLLPGITPVEYCSFIDYNDNSQLNRFGVRNGGAQGPGLLNEKWESLALLPVDGDKGKDGEFFLLSISDNDFITQNGFMNSGKYKYKDASGADLDNQALLFRVKLPVA